MVVATARTRHPLRVRLAQPLPYPFSEAEYLVPATEGSVLLIRGDCKVLASVPLREAWFMARPDPGYGSPDGCNTYAEGSGAGADYGEEGEGSGVGIGAYGCGDLYLQGSGSLDE
jgi:hypothetical protein